MNAGRRVGQELVKNGFFRRGMAYTGQTKKITMNDMPKPEGDFFALHAQRQRKHNAVFIIGLVMFSSSLYLIKETKLINFNWSPPDSVE